MTLKHALPACAALLGLSAPSFAALTTGTIINMDFHGAAGTGSGPAIIGSAGDAWNLGGGGSFNNLADTGSTGTSVNYYGGTPEGTTSGVGAHGWGTDPVAQDYIYLQDNDLATIALPDGSYAGVGRRFTIYVNGSNDLNANQTWNLHMIGAGDNGEQGANFMLKQGGSWQSISNDGNPAFGGTYVQGDNYGSFLNVTPTAWGGGAGSQQFEFELYWFWTDPDTVVDQGTGLVTSGTPGGNNRYTAFNGFQMELLTVPEPGTTLLGALAGLFLLRRRR